MVLIGIASSSLSLSFFKVPDFWLYWVFKVLSTELSLLMVSARRIPLLFRLSCYWLGISSLLWLKLYPICSPPWKLEPDMDLVMAFYILKFFLLRSNSLVLPALTVLSGEVSGLKWGPLRLSKLIIVNYSLALDWSILNVKPSAYFSRGTFCPIGELSFCNGVFAFWEVVSYAVGS